MAKYDSGLADWQGVERLPDPIPDSLVGHKPFARPIGLVRFHCASYSATDE